MKVGDNHDWGIWHGERNFNHVDSVIAPFVSEFGFPSLPNGYKESTDSLYYQYLPFRSYKGLSLLNRYSKNEPKLGIFKQPSLIQNCDILNIIILYLYIIFYKLISLY